MGLYSRIKEVAETHGYSINKLEKELEFPKGSISKYDTNQPSIAKIVKIADLFDIPVDELLARSNDDDEKANYIVTKTKNNQETKLLLSFRGAGDLSDEEFSDLEDMFESTIELYLKARGSAKRLKAYEESIEKYNKGE